MDDTLDFVPQVRVVTQLAAGTRDDQLDGPTPCEGLAVRNLLGHLVALAAAFRDAARKQSGPFTDTGPDVASSGIGPGWRTELAENLEELADAWRAPEAWQGATKAGGIDLPGAVAGRVAMDELILHGWDLARATGQPYAPDPAGLEAAHALLAATPDGPDRAGMFGPIVPVPEDAPLLERVIGLSGRRPDWPA